MTKIRLGPFLFYTAHALKWIIIHQKRFSFSETVYRVGRCARRGSVEIPRTRRRVRSRSHRAATVPRQLDHRRYSEGRASDRGTRQRLVAQRETVHTPPHLHIHQSYTNQHPHHTRACLRLYNKTNFVLASEDYGKYQKVKVKRTCIAHFVKLQLKASGMDHTGLPLQTTQSVSYTHLTLPTIYSV